jgi:hypothetical protein
MPKNLLRNMSGGRKLDKHLGGRENFTTTVQTKESERPLKKFSNLLKQMQRFSK